MQEAGGFDWAHALSGAGGGIIGALGAIGTWLFRAGGKEPKMRAEVKQSIDDAEKKVEDKVEVLVTQFQETFSGLRRQFDEHRLHTETNFLRKDDFNQFRDEYREDMRDLKVRLDRIPRSR